MPHRTSLAVDAIFLPFMVASMRATPAYESERRLQKQIARMRRA
jgi:hypothetical protein